MMEFFDGWQILIGYSNCTFFLAKRYEATAGEGLIAPSVALFTVCSSFEEVFREKVVSCLHLSRVRF